jgi:hypothetical protein
MVTVSLVKAKRMPRGHMLCDYILRYLYNNKKYTTETKRQGGIGL